MPFTASTFQPIGGQARSGTGPVAAPGAPQLWSYRTDDAATAVDTSGYFNAVASLLEVGDLIYRITVNGAGAIVSAGWHVVLTKTAAGVVDVSDTSALSITNTD